MLRSVGAGTVAQLIGQFVEIQPLKEIEDSLGTHAGDELIGITVFKHLVFLGQCLQQIEVFFLGKQVSFSDLVFESTWLYDHVTLVIDDGVKFLGGNAQQVTYFVGQRPEVPDVGHGNNQVNVSGAFTAHFLFGHFHSTAVAHDPLVANTFVFAAMTFIVFNGSKNTLAKQTITFGLVGAIVDGFGFQHLTKRVFQNLFRRCQPNCDF